MLTTSRHPAKITYDEVLQISIAIYALLGFNVAPAHNAKTYEEHARKVFKKLDTAKAGFITYDQFKEICLKVSLVLDLDFTILTQHFLSPSGRDHLQVNGKSGYNFALKQVHQRTLTLFSFSPRSLIISPDSLLTLCFPLLLTEYNEPFAPNAPQRTELGLENVGPTAAGLRNSKPRTSLNTRIYQFTI